MSCSGACREQRRLRPVGDIEAPYNLFDVRFDRAFAHIERVRDQFVRFAFSDQREDIALAARQQAPWCALGGRGRLGQSQRHVGAAGTDPLGHRRAILLLREAVGADPPEVHIVGGGAQNRLLCQWTADATRLPVLAGPAEATSIGNLAVQILALGELGSLADVRAIAGGAFAPLLYEPRDAGAWDEAYSRVERLTGGAGRPAEEALTP